MAIGNGLGLGNIFASGAAQQSTMIANNTSGAYQNPAYWDQDRAHRDEMIRREERYKYEQMQAQMYRDEIRRYGVMPDGEPVKKEAVKKAPVDNFPEGREKNLLLLLEQ